MTDQNEMSCPIHLSLVRPILLAGADRNLVMINMTIIAMLIFWCGNSLGNYHFCADFFGNRSCCISGSTPN
jgi:type IV secretory pathway TrbD component